MCKRAMSGGCVRCVGGGRGTRISRGRTLVEETPGSPLAVGLNGQETFGRKWLVGCS